MQDDKRYRAAALVDLSALEWNIRQIMERLAQGVKLMAVVKADAYGHGFSGLYPTFKACGVDQYAVAFWQEGARLRERGVTEPILILGDTMEEEMEEAVRYDLMPAIFTETMAGAYSRAAVRAGIRGRVHIKLDTGMGRIGFPCVSETAEAIGRIGELPGISIEGIFSHFARADEADKTDAKRQYERFRWMLKQLEQRGIRIPERHIDNSAAIMEMEDTQQSMVRAGIILYGLYPSGGGPNSPSSLAGDALGLPCFFREKGIGGNAHRLRRRVCDLEAVGNRYDSGGICRRLQPRTIRPRQRPNPRTGGAGSRTSLHGSVHGGCDGDSGSLQRGRGDSFGRGDDRRKDGRSSGDDFV